MRDIYACGPKMYIISSSKALGKHGAWNMDKCCLFKSTLLKILRRKNCIVREGFWRKEANTSTKLNAPCFLQYLDRLQYLLQPHFYFLTTINVMGSLSHLCKNTAVNYTGLKWVVTWLLIISMEKEFVELICDTHEVYGKKKVWKYEEAKNLRSREAKRSWK